MLLKWVWDFSILFCLLRWIDFSKKKYDQFLIVTKTTCLNKLNSLYSYLLVSQQLIFCAMLFLCTHAQKIRHGARSLEGRPNSS